MSPNLPAMLRNQGVSGSSLDRHVGILPRFRRLQTSRLTAVRKGSPGQPPDSIGMVGCPQRGGYTLLLISDWWYSFNPLKNDGVKVSWDDEIPNIWKNNMFQSTNQIGYIHSVTCRWYQSYPTKRQGTTTGSTLQKVRIDMGNQSIV